MTIKREEPLTCFRRGNRSSQKILSSSRANKLYIEAGFAALTSCALSDSLSPAICPMCSEVLIGSRAI